MDEGRIRGTDEIWPADQIWQLGDASSIHWCCIGCNAPLTPSAWRPERNHKRAAHFAARDGHFPQCTADGLEKMIATGGRKNIRTADGLPGPYPAAVRFVERRERVEGEGHPVEGVRDAFRLRAGGGDRPQNANHRRTVTTIRQICRFYHAFPLLRGLALEVHGCTGESYFGIFQPLSNNYTGEVGGKILYAGIRFKEIPDYGQRHLRIALNLRNVREVDGEAAQQPVYLEVDWTNWNTVQRGLFRNQFEEIRSALEQRYRKSVKGKKPSATLYFIGRKIDADTYCADDHRKICLIGA